MPKVTFITQDGDEVAVDDAAGSLMEIALENDVEGIDGDCGGVCSCSTCHVYVKPDWLSQTGQATEAENDILAYNDHKTDRSRLGCQIELTSELDGLVVEVAPRD